jgi:hypothetical protein
MKRAELKLNNGCWEFFLRVLDHVTHKLEVTYDFIIAYIQLLEVSQLANCGRQVLEIVTSCASVITPMIDEGDALLTLSTVKLFSRNNAVGKLSGVSCETVVWSRLTWSASS